MFYRQIFPNPIVTATKNFLTMPIWVFRCLQRSSTGWLILLATPKFPYVPESTKKQSPELTTLWNDQVQDLPPPKNGRVQNLPPLKSPELGTLSCFWGGKSRTLFFLDSGTYGNLGVAWRISHPVWSGMKIVNSYALPNLCVYQFLLYSRPHHQ